MSTLLINANPDNQQHIPHYSRSIKAIRSRTLRQGKAYSGLQGRLLLLVGASCGAEAGKSLLSETRISGAINQNQIK